MTRRTVALAAVTAALVSSTTATAQGPAPEGVTVTGVASVGVERPERLTDRTIQRAVAESFRTAVPRAVRDARANAGLIAQAAGLTLGPITSVSQGPEYAFYRPFSSRYCRTVRSRRTRRGRVRLPRPREVCRVPPETTVVVRVTFARN